MLLSCCAKNLCCSTEAMEWSIFKVMFEGSQCLDAVSIHAAHPYCTSCSCDKPLPYPLRKTFITFVGGVVLDEPLECTSVAFASVIGTLKFLDGMTPSRNILEESGMHGAVSITNKLYITNSVTPFRLQKPLQDNVSLHLRG